MATQLPGQRSAELLCPKAAGTERMLGVNDCRCHVFVGVAVLRKLGWRGGVCAAEAAQGGWGVCVGGGVRDEGSRRGLLMSWLALAALEPWS